jgi:hypothetical protein
MPAAALFEILLQRLRTLDNIAVVPQFAVQIETTHPMRYCRIDRTVRSETALGFLPLVDQRFEMPRRGLLLT